MTELTTAALTLPLAAPGTAAGLALVLRPRQGAWLSTGAAAIILASGAWLATGTAAVAGAPATAGPLRADALSAYLLIVIGAVATLACWAAVYQDTLTRRYLALVQLFLATMSLAVLADNLGLLWVAIEATTIVTAFLVGHRHTRASVEAAWKYVVLCSIGIAIALLGTVCVYAAAVHAGATGASALNWSYLHAHASGLDPAVLRLAAGLLLVGFGTKAGLAPMHAWLPDAHSQAPAPVSALMSGVLLSVAFYALLRYKTILDAALGPAYLRALLFVAALASIAVAAALLIAQRDVKRMLAYSSIEHMGLIALGTAVGGPMALAAVLLHILGHGLAKAVAFCGAGQVLRVSQDTRIAAIRGLAASHPALAFAFGLGLITLLGFPPFSLFASELGIARAGVAAGYGWAVAAGFGLVLVAFVALARHGGAMLLGPGVATAPPDASPDASPGATAPPDASPAPVALAHGVPRGTVRHASTAGLAPLLVGLAGAAALGVSLGPLQTLLHAAAAVVGGS